MAAFSNTAGTAFPHAWPLNTLKQELFLRELVVVLDHFTRSLPGPTFQVKSGFYFSFPCSVREVWVTFGERVTQLLLAVVFMLLVYGLLYFLEFLSVDNSSFVFLSSFQYLTYPSHGTYHS